MANWSNVADAIVDMLVNDVGYKGAGHQYKHVDLTADDLVYAIVRNPVTRMDRIGTAGSYQAVILFDVDVLVLEIDEGIAHLSGEQESQIWENIPALFDAVAANSRLALGGSDLVAKLICDDDAKLGRFLPASDANRGRFAGFNVKLQVRF